MKLKPYEFRDPGEVLADVMERHPLSEGDAVLALVENPSGRQRVTQVEVLPAPARIEDCHEVSDLLCETVRRMPIPARGPSTRIDHAVMTILVRRGLTVFGRNESNWFYGWRYSNHLIDAYTGDVVLVTEHGWRDFMTDWGDHYPRIAC